MLARCVTYHEEDQMQYWIFIIVQTTVQTFTVLRETVLQLFKLITMKSFLCVSCEITLLLVEGILPGTRAFR